MINPPCMAQGSNRPNQQESGGHFRGQRTTQNSQVQISGANLFPTGPSGYSLQEQKASSQKN
eukprot:1141262-Pelagomonas_calceolata.AAC.4